MGRSETATRFVKLYLAQRDSFETFASNFAATIRSHGDIKPYIHSVKYRTKDPVHLRKKLLKKPAYLTGPKRITESTLFHRINDLVGVRILHLNTRQFKDIDAGLRKMFDEWKYRVYARPFARTWDDESRNYFKGLGIRIEKSPTMYTSVHYVIEPNKKFTCEIQVRTLMEEVWGEVDHTLNYPKKTKSIACGEQILALARATSSCTRLVDSIFASHSEHLKLQRG